MNTSGPQPLFLGAVSSGMSEEKGEGRGGSGCQPASANGHTKEHFFQGRKVLQ